MLYDTCMVGTQPDSPRRVDVGARGVSGIHSHDGGQGVSKFPLPETIAQAVLSFRSDK